MLLLYVNFVFIVCEIDQKLKVLRGWEDGKELRQAQLIINKMWTCLLRGNRKYRTNQLQMHVSSWQRKYIEKIYQLCQSAV